MEKFLEEFEVKDFTISLQKASYIKHSSCDIRSVSKLIIKKMINYVLKQKLLKEFLIINKNSIICD